MQACKIYVACVNMFRGVILKTGCWNGWGKHRAQQWHHLGMVLGQGLLTGPYSQRQTLARGEDAPDSTFLHPACTLPSPPLCPQNRLPCDTPRGASHLVLNYNMRMAKWKKKSFLSQSRTEKILRYAKEIRRRAVYSLGGTRPAFEADKSLLVIQYLNQN